MVPAPVAVEYPKLLAVTGTYQAGVGGLGGGGAGVLMGGKAVH